MSEVLDRFLRYVSYDTQSKEEEEAIPSTSSQLALAKLLRDELTQMGAAQVRMDDHGYVYAKILSNTSRSVPALGFIAHMDTSPALSGRDVKPQLVKNYDGGDICLNHDLGIVLSPADFPELLEYKGQTLVTTDGTTLLGADDKAGAAEIMSMAAWLIAHPEEEHGDICIAFTPDEEVGRGADLFDVDGFGAAGAYTVDGGALGELEYENFNAASARLTIQGSSIHPGSAKGRMKNAILIGMEFQSLLPAFENPMYTEGYEGFYHLDHMEGNVEQAVLEYIIRDHDREKFEKKKVFFQQAADFLNQKYGENTVQPMIRDSYYNMREIIEPHFYLVERAKAAMEELGITPQIVPIRGGTDGARLSYMGLPCPNLCAGGLNAHGKFEYVPVESMERIVELLVRLALAPIKD